MSMKEITPQSMVCVIGACPAIFETEDGFVLIGSQVQMGELVDRIGKGEVAIKVPKRLLLEASLKSELS